MSDIAIRVDNLSKQYRIGGPQARYKTIRESLTEAVQAPFRRLASVVRGQSSAVANETIWALKDVSFEVKRGEVVGIIGRNGAGKSTLLKILSRITEPTEGRAEIHGRVGSLLEVGTGFHPELTGRENITLNGAILGMKRAEIERKFDEIVEFAEIERFIDTPVKHYSSGMYVRLAFAVAAHMEPEILLVDEVLAVGDVYFQKKCLGKMEEVAKEGRTVLFVSHNMGAILTLCEKAILLSDGNMLLYASTKEAVKEYLSLADQSYTGHFRRDGFDESRDLVRSAEIRDEKGARKIYFNYGEPLHILLRTNPILKEKFGKFGVELRIKNSQQQLIGYISSWINSHSKSLHVPGEDILVEIPKLKLVQDNYYVDIICRVPLVYHVDNWWDTVHFTVTNCRPGGSPISIQDIDHLGSVVFDEAVVIGGDATKC